MKRLTFTQQLSTAQTWQMIGLAGLTTLLLTFIPALQPFNYPFRLLLTIVHELGHGLAAVFTGGEFVRFVVFADGRGLAYTAGGWRLFVIPAGYLGTAAFGALLILLGRNAQWSRAALIIIGLLLMLLSVRYGIPSILSYHILWGVLTTLSGVVLGSIFVMVALQENPSISVFCIHLVAIQAGLTAFGDIWVVMGLATQMGQVTLNDAQSMAELTFIPAIVWATIWAIVALLLIGGAIWVTWVQPLMARR